MKKRVVLTALAASITAYATDYPYAIATTASFGVKGSFNDDIVLTVPAAGAYSFTVASVKANAGCQRFKSCGYFYGRVDSAQLQDSSGTVVGDLPEKMGANPSYSAAFTLAPGIYRIHVTGVGLGTVLHVGAGSYTVTSNAPPSPVVYSCDYIRDLLRTQGFAEATVEQIVVGYQAQVPPVCTGD
jgi:hypothetical protein